VYTNYFGLKEPSFSITPDPQYLFLSEQHREALAHLLYGAGESGGFVLLTGEVGTGKTTVCRAFLEQLPEAVDVALILNPAMTAAELLRAVCEEFRIQVPDAACSVKCLIDRLNECLLAKHAAGRRAVLMIDEAQNLRPKVLEQVRLLTNLETPKHKLLQIFLVGQPELRSLLQRKGLRQLNQRITARYHLRPFDAADTAEYIRHRLAVAGVERQLFTAAAVRLVHRISGGVPRLINILCDRCLLGACVTRSPVATRAIVLEAAREVEDPTWRQRTTARYGRAGLIAAGLALAVVVGWTNRSRLADELADAAPGQGAAAFLARFLPAAVDAEEIAGAASAQDAPGPPVSDAAAPPHANPPAAGAIAESSAGAAPVGLVAPGEHAPNADFVPTQVTMDEASAMRLLLRRWGIDLAEPGTGDPCALVADFGLRCARERSGFAGLRATNRPALVELADPARGPDTAQGEARGYAVIGAVDDAEVVTFDRPGGNLHVPRAAVEAYWEGAFLVLWQPPPTAVEIIGPGAGRASVRWLRALLSQVPDLGVAASAADTFDRELGQAVRRFQTREGLVSDGIAGPKTLMRLYDVLEVADIPRLDSAP